MKEARRINSFDLLEEIIFFENSVAKITDNARRIAMQTNQFNFFEYTNKLNRLLQEHKSNLKKYSSNFESSRETLVSLG